MEALTIKELAPYLPYRLKIVRSKDSKGDRKVMNTGQGGGKHWIGIGAVIKWQDVVSRPMPLMRPLSDLTKEITHNGETFVPIEKIKNPFQTPLIGIGYRKS